MKKGLTQGGTSSPALFRMFINDLPETVRGALRAHEKLKADLEPIFLVTNDVVGLVNDQESLQLLLDACHDWAEEKKLSWNQKKSKILCTTAEESAISAEIQLGRTPLKCVNEVEYLGLRLGREGFMGKKPMEVEKKCK